MSDEPKPNKGELIPPINRSLTRKKSDLVKRGLELIQVLRKQRVRVQIGNMESWADAFYILIKKVIKDKYDLNLGISCNGEELLELAKDGVIDIFILVMNNIRFSTVDSLEDRLENSLQLITQIKTTYGKPVIALSGLPKSNPLVARAALAADFFLLVPFSANDFMEAFEKCLSMLHGFNEVPRRRVKGSKRHTTT